MNDSRLLMDVADLKMENRNMLVDIAVLEVKLEKADMALKLAHDNIKAWIGLAVTVTAIVVSIVMKLIK